RDGNEMITAEELTHWLRQLGVNSTKAEVQAMLSNVGTDDKITFTQFLSHLEQQHNGPYSEDELWQLFTVYDYDKNGYIGASDLKTVMKMVDGRELDYEEIWEIIDEVDLDGDGLISFEEFVILVRD